MKTNKTNNDAASASGKDAGSVDRRSFLKVLGAGAVSASLSGERALLMAGPFAAVDPGIQHFVPAEKKLTAAWVRQLFERGSRRVCRGKELETIGMPVGGIGAGQLYLRGDGTLGCWQIFNKRHFSGYGADSYKYRTVDAPVDQGFAIVLEEPSGRSVTPLDRVGFPGVEFCGEYPIGEVRYARKGFPIEASMEAFSPFIPLSAKDSSLPATLFHITLKNASDRKVKGALLGWLENVVCRYSAADVRGERTVRSVAEKGRRLLVHSAREASGGSDSTARPPVVLADFEGKDYGRWKVEGKAFGTAPARGSLPGQQKVSGFQGKGLVNTFLDGDASRGRLTSPPFEITRRYVSFLMGGGKYKGSTCMRLLVDDEAVREAHGENKEELRWRSWNVAELEGKTARIEIIDDATGRWGHINVDQIELSDKKRGGPTGPVDRLEDHGTLVLALEGAGAALETKGLRAGRDDVPWVEDGAFGGGPLGEAAYAIEQRKKAGLLSETVELAPGASRTFTWVLAWHFPNRPQGNAYARRLHDAVEVAHHVLDQHDRLAGDTRLWRKTYYDSTLPRWLLDRIHATVSNLATGTCQWWGNGRFWAWEGVGCCSGTCTHVWNYAHALARLFPELERSAREMQDLGEAMDPDGLIGFRGVRNGHYAADGQAGTILKCYREHQMSADGSFLKRNWPNIKKALLYSIRQDGNDDGLIENSQHNTFDINFVGANTFVGALYLGALRAGEEMAREAGDGEFAARLRKIFERGSRLSVQRLWDGEYFIQDVDVTKHPKFQYGKGCLSDQLFGQGWAHQVGLGYLYPRDLVAGGLKSVWKYNWAPDIAAQNRALKPERWFVSPGEAGLFTCTWPKSGYLKEGVRYRNEVWTGIEYQVAGHMAREGLVTEALAICRAVHDRYDPRKHNPYNEVECGDHYARALASWGVLTSLAGYEHHGPARHIGFAPRLTPEDFRSVFTAAEGWGTFSQKRSGGVQTGKIDVVHGRLRLRTLAFETATEGPGALVEVKAGGRKVGATVQRDGKRVSVRLEQEAQVRAGESLEVVIG